MIYRSNGYLRSRVIESRNRSRCASAARYGGLQLLQWAREHGCEWDAHTIDAARDNGCAATIEYVRAHGCPAEYLPDYYSDDDDESSGGESSDSDHDT